MRVVSDDPERVARWVSAKNGNEINSVNNLAIGLEKDGQLIAGTLYEGYNGRSICLHTAIEHMNRDFLWYCFYYPFIELNVIKLLGVVDSFNTRAIKLDRHLGFVLESTVKDAGKQGDLLIFSMTKDQCPWLNVARHTEGSYGWISRRRQRQQCA